MKGDSAEPKASTAVCQRTEGVRTVSPNSTPAGTVTREMTDESSLGSAPDNSALVSSLVSQVGYPTPSPDSQLAQGFRPLGLGRSLSSSQRISSMVQTPPITPDSSLPVKTLGEAVHSSLPVSHQCAPHAMASLGSSRTISPALMGSRSPIHRSLFPGIDVSDSAMSFRPLLPAGQSFTGRSYMLDPMTGCSPGDKRPSSNVQPIAPKISPGMMSPIPAMAPSPSSLVSISPVCSNLSSRTPTPTASARKERRRSDGSQRQAQRRKPSAQLPLDLNGPQIRT